MFERYDPETDTQFRALAKLADMPGSLGMMLSQRFLALVRMIQRVACEAAECCAEAKAIASEPPDVGSLLILGTGDDTQELNNVTAARVKWDTNHQIGEGFTVKSAAAIKGRVVVDQDGWYRIWSVLTYDGFVTDGSIEISIQIDGSLTLPGAGQQGVIANANGHISASSNIESWAELVDGQYIDVMSAQNGAGGSINPIPLKSLLIIERRPYPPGSTS